MWCQHTRPSVAEQVGIIFHSIFIGVTLGVSTNASTTTALMIALFFHQVCDPAPGPMQDTDTHSTACAANA